jgi:V/A-type H+-transporting ATPase subunit I
MLALFYPLFFGMIVGDIGYGLIMLALVVWLRVKFKENPGVQVATSILGPAATSVVVFGFIYGEFFGDIFGTKMMNIIHPIFINGTQIFPFERTKPEMLITFLIITLIIGFVQVALGLALGVYNGIKTKHWSHVYEKGGILAFVVGFISLILLVVFGTVISAHIGSIGAYIVQAVAALVLFVGLVYAVRGGQVLGVIESIGAIADIASYLRIMAVGLAGAIFAEAVNGIAVKMGNPILGLAVAIPLQALNFVLAAFSPNIHAIRLNFLEFFKKFYEPGTKDYKPFQKTGGENKA